jgi:hypothetical protein
MLKCTWCGKEIDGIPFRHKGELLCKECKGEPDYDDWWNSLKNKQKAEVYWKAGDMIARGSGN